MADTEPPPSYHSVFAKIEQNVGEKPSPDKLLAVVDALSPAEKQAIDNKKFNKATVMQGADHTAFQKGVNDYLASEAAQIRLKTNADEAANACKLIDTMFTALTVKLGEVDAKSPAPTEKFSPKLADLQKIYREILHESKKLALEMAEYGNRWENTILQACLDKKYPLAKKQAKLQEFIDAATKFETSSKKIVDDFNALKYNFGGFTGSFASWAHEKEKTLSDQITQITNDIANLQREIEEIQKKMLLTGLIGGPALVGVTAGLCAFLGPIGLVAGLIGLGVGLGFMIYWNNQISHRNEEIAAKRKQISELKVEKDAISATRIQLVELGQNSLNTFSDQIGKLNNVWEYALNDARKVQLKLKDINKDIDDIEFDSFRQSILQSIGSTQGLYSVMSLYLQRYADGVSSVKEPKP